MKNDEFIIQINTVIDYLKKNNDYNHKGLLYNKNLNSNIIKYVEDIKKFYIQKYTYDSYEEHIINEICTIIEDNLKLFLLNDNKLLKLKSYCKNKENSNYKSPSYEFIIAFVEEALFDLLTTNHLYDYRDLK